MLNRHIIRTRNRRHGLCYACTRVRVDRMTMSDSDAESGIEADAAVREAKLLQYP